MSFEDVVTEALKSFDTEVPATLALSKGGWEGWLQCQLWYQYNVARVIGAGREVPYPPPSATLRCDLVVEFPGQASWIEIKAFGIFREGDANAFIESIAKDLAKLQSRPAATTGVMLVALPVSSGDDVKQYIRTTWPGFREFATDTIVLFAVEV